MELKLFDTPQDQQEWEKEWVGMPEFIQSKTKEPYAKITIRFDCKEDLDMFSKLINQKLTKKTKSTWYPSIERGKTANKIYEDEE